MNSSLKPSFSIDNLLHHAAANHWAAFNSLHTNKQQPHNISTDKQSEHKDVDKTAESDNETKMEMDKDTEELNQSSEQSSEQSVNQSSGSDTVNTSAAMAMLNLPAVTMSGNLLANVSAVTQPVGYFITSSITSLTWIKLQK